MLTSKSPPHSTKYERFNEMKRYLETLNKQPQTAPSSHVYKSGANPYLSPLSLGRLQQLQIGKKFLKEMRTGPQQYHTTLNSPNSRGTGVPTIQIPKRIALNPAKEVDASHGVISHQIRHAESNRSQSKSKKPSNKTYSGLHESLHQQYLAGSEFSMSPLSPELVSQTRLDPNSRHFKLHLQPWSIYYIPGNDPNTFITPPARKIPPNEKIERELKDFKKEIDQKFAKTPMKNFVFPRSFSIHSQEEEFTEYGDDFAFISDSEEEESENEGRMLSSPPYPGALLQHQQIEARKNLKTGAAPRGVRPSPLRQIELVDQRSKISRSSSKDAYLGGSGKLPSGMKNRNITMNPNKQTKLVPYGYAQHSQAVAALVSPTTRAYEKKIGFGNVAKNAQQKRKKTTGSKTMNFSDYDRGALGQYAASSMPSQRAWEDSQLISPKIMSHGGGTGSALTPPPGNLSDSTFDMNQQQQQGSPRNMTHRSFILPGDKTNQKYLHKTGAHSKSQHYKQKFVPGGAIGPPAQQAFTPVVGRVMKKSRTPRELLSQDQIQPPQSIPLNSSPINKGVSNAPGGGTGSITYHQAETTTANSSSYRSLRQGNSSQSSRKPQPLQEMNVPLTPSKQNHKYAGTARQRVLPPQLIASYLKQSPHGTRPLTTQNRAAQSVQKYYPTGYSAQYHGKWSILGSTTGYSKSPHDSLYMSHESVKSKGGTYRGAGHQRSKTSHVESSQSQLGIASDSESVNPKTSGRANQSQFSAGRKKKKSLKNPPSYLPKQNTFELNTSYDTAGVPTRAMHSTTLSRELNMINQELQNADKTMKLLTDAEDLKLGYLKQGHPVKPQQQVRSHLQQICSVKSRSSESTPQPTTISRRRRSLQNKPSQQLSERANAAREHADLPILWQQQAQGKNLGNMQQQYKKRFKNPVLRETQEYRSFEGGAPPPTGALSRSSQRDQ